MVPFFETGVTKRQAVLDSFLYILPRHGRRKKMRVVLINTGKVVDRFQSKTCMELRAVKAVISSFFYTRIEFSA